MTGFLFHLVYFIFNIFLLLLMKEGLCIIRCECRPLEKVPVCPLGGVSNILRAPYALLGSSRKFGFSFFSHVLGTIVELPRFKAVGSNIPWGQLFLNYTGLL